jgi:hypothetical protein
MNLTSSKVSGTYQYLLNQVGSSLTLGNGNEVDWDGAKVMMTTGNQTINGTKTFSSYLTVNTNQATMLNLNGSSNSYLGIAFKMTDASASTQRSSFIDTRNESSIAVSVTAVDILTDGSTDYYISTTPAGLRTSDRRVERLRIKGNGNVGIGIYNPTYKIHIAGVTTQYDSSIQINESTYATSRRAGINFGNWNLGQDANGNGTKDFYFYDGNASQTRFYIGTNGNVGIGTVSPTSTLDVRGLISNYVGTAGTQTILQNWGYGNAIARWKPVIESDASFSLYGYDNAGASPNNRVTINNNNGNVGLGTSIPTEKLHVGGNILSNNLLLQGDNINGYIKTTNSSSNLYLGANNATFLTILANGNVGIGTTTPAYQLQLTTNSAAKPSSTAWTVPSDKRIKKNIRPYTKGLNSLITINPVLYDYNGKINFEQTVDNVGLIAQDIKDEFPECINTFKAKLNTTDKEDTELLNFDSHALTFVLINSIKELKQIIDSQNLRISELESKLL